MPKRVLIIGLLFVISGMLSVWSMIEAATHSRIYLNFGVLLLPVGVGLLRGRVSSQWWARFWIILGYIVLVLQVGEIIAHPQNAWFSWFGSVIRGSRSIPYAIVFSALFGVGLYICHRFLYSKKAIDYLCRR